MKLKNLKPGDRIIPDDRFDCMRAGTVKVVRRDQFGNLYVRCGKSGVHRLDGDVNILSGHLLGWKKAKA